jgi:hypothetical protein
VKFTFLVLAGCCIAVLVVLSPRENRLRGPTALVATFFASAIALWLLAGQSLRNVPKFLSGSLQIAAGYSAAMGTEGPREYLSTSIEVLVLLAIACALGVSVDLLSRRRLAGLAIAIGGLLLSWKEGFVRQGGHNASLFFGYAAFFPGLLVVIDDASAKPAALLRNAFLSLASLLSIGVLRAVPLEAPRQPLSLTATYDRVLSNLSVLTSPSAKEQALEVAWDFWHEKGKLRAVRARVGADPMDVVSYDLSIGFWNDVTWRSRPVLQGYAAYTPSLAALNANFFRRADAPRFVLSRWASIDDHFASADDGQTLLELLREYRPVLTERKYLLLEHRRDPDDEDRVGRVVFSKQVPFGERIALTSRPHGWLTLTVKVSYTPLGAMRRRFYWVPPMSISVELPRSGETKPKDLFPEPAASEFLVSPLVESNTDIGQIYDGNGRSAVAVRLRVSDAARACLGDSALVTLTEYGGLKLPRRRGSQ